MSLVETKSAILYSLSEMDRKNSEKVLSFIKDLLSERETLAYENFKANALKEINDALNKDN